MRTIALLFVISTLGGQELFKELSFPVSKIEIKEYKEYMNVRFPDCERITEIGAPELPVFPLYIHLPKGAKVLGVDTVRTMKSEYRLRNSVKPSQPPVILSKLDSPLRFVPPNPQIYKSLQPYPGKLVEFVSQGNLSDTSVAEILIYPVQYIPQTQKLFVYSKIEIRIRYRIEGSPMPSSVDDGFEYLIITPTSFDTIFERFARWKTKKGIPTVVRRIGDITRSSPGVDNQEKIRNYLKAAYKDSGLKWLLLGGDVQLIPLRYAFAMACSSGGVPPRNEDWLPCDLYYSDLDGTWDANHNRIYGEVEDSVDLYPDIWVGRAPVENIVEAQNFVDKTLLYEKTPPLDYQNRLLFLADVLWRDPYTDAGVAKDMIDDRHIPERAKPVTKLYKSKGNENLEAVVSAMDQGYNIINHDGHGWVTLLGVGDGALVIEDAASLTNSPRNSIIFSIGCWTNAFDFNDCIGEEFIKNPEGGGVAYIGNGSYGWGSPGNPGYGYSDRFDEEFYKKIYRDSIFELGRVLGMDKAHFIAFSRDENVYRWHQYELNLLGDPELSVWTDTPETLQVLYPPSIPEQGGNIRVVVRQGNRPVKGARVCLWKADQRADQQDVRPMRDVCLGQEEEIYLRGFTSEDGGIAFSIPPISGGKIALTITAHNFLPKEEEIEVITKGPYLSYLDKKIEDGGNQDGIANPGEEISLSLLFKNQGKESATNINLGLRTENLYIEMIDSTEYLEEIKSEDSLWVDDGFRFKIGADCPDKEAIHFTLIVSGTNYSGVFHPSIIVGRPDLYIYKTEITDSLGNKNHIIEPSEEVLIRVWLKNRGFGNGYNTWARLISNDSKIVVEEDSAEFGSVEKGGLKKSSNFYKVKVLSGCPASYHSYLVLRINSEGETFEDSLLLMVGSVGLLEDVEGGVEGWEMGGDHNLWHISTHNSHSPSHSFYCGSDSTGTFLKNSEEELTSPPFVIGENFALSFWRRFVLPIYGTAGLYVEVYNKEWNTIDFIGSGGALGKLEVRSEWAKERYELNYPVGETLRVRLRFVSDGADPTEGFYIDDILVGEKLGIADKKSDLTKKCFSYSLSPNPTKGKAEIRFEIGDMGYGSPIDLTIYDAMGRKVKALAKIQSPEPRVYILSWDGTDDKGKKVPSGIYFSVLRVNNRSFPKKVIYLRSNK